MADPPLAHLLEYGRNSKESVYFAFQEQFRRGQSLIDNPAYVFIGVQADQAGHDGEERLVSLNCNSDSPAFQVANSTNIVSAENFEAAAMQPGQYRQRYSGIHADNHIGNK